MKACSKGIHICLIHSFQDILTTEPLFNETVHFEEESLSNAMKVVTSLVSVHSSRIIDEFLKLD